jgi:hypothetical protein
MIYSNNKSQIQVRNISTGQVQTYSLSNYYLQFGDYVWPPHESKVIFVGAPEEWYDKDSRFALFMVDVENQKLLQLYESSLPFYFPVSWGESDKVIVSKFNKTSNWTLDLSTTSPVITPLENP